MDEFELKKYEVHYDGKIVHYINPNLAQQQELTDLQIDQLKDLHIIRMQLYERIDYFLEADPNHIPALLIEYTSGEYEMQRLWGFPEDSNYHRFWDIPACACPKMDNNERVGTEYTVISGGCPLHGTNL
jgi:hypothetical protein